MQGSAVRTGKIDSDALRFCGAEPIMMQAPFSDAFTSAADQLVGKLDC